VRVKGLWYYWMHWRPTFWNDMTPDEVAALKPHADYVASLYDEGRILLAGGITEPAGGAVFVFADSREEAEGVLANDPLVASGIVEITLHEFRPALIGTGPPFDFRARSLTGA
jgi:uncharacterized protein YciI